ncbi:hypothetical protein MHI57_16030 [Cytobacillus sp. FSL K6-0129]|uniref:hypothetical protein n=1 Tax=Cytobacillus sp. FSL K6-0129 TaxID=2921421 RepID=UPI0030F5A065
MRLVLFDAKNEVTIEEMVAKMNYYIEKSQQGMEAYEGNKKLAFEIAKELRKELDIEYKNNSLNKVKSFYEDNLIFDSYYRPAVHKAVASIAGRLTYGNVFSFLYDVNDYMDYHKPDRVNN